MDPQYSQLQALFASSSATAFSPLLPPSLMAPIASVTLPVAFASAFYFTTLKKQPVQEAIAGTVASVAAGLGVVALFNAVGVYV